MGAKRFFKRLFKEQSDKNTHEDISNDLQLEIINYDSLANSHIEEAKPILRQITDPTVINDIATVGAIVRQGEGSLIIARDNGKAIGAAVLVRDRQQEIIISTYGHTRHIEAFKSGYRTIHLLAVDSAHRKSGVGQALIAAAESAAQSINVRNIYAILEDNSEAVAFFNKHGYNVLKTGELFVLRTPGVPPYWMPLDPPHRWAVKVV